MNSKCMEGKSLEQKVPVLCLACRLAFKREPARLKGETRDPHYNMAPLLFPIVAAPCPRCHQPTVFLGKYFKVPPKSAVKVWRELQDEWVLNLPVSRTASPPKSLLAAKKRLKKQKRRRAHVRRVKTS